MHLTCARTLKAKKRRKLVMVNINSLFVFIRMYSLLSTVARIVLGLVLDRKMQSWASFNNGASFYRCKKQKKKEV